jgi:fermentation-respiration switch protein FrsA (DUF1100 family)
MKKMMVSAGIILLAAYAFIVGTMYWKQDSMIYFPEREIINTPQSVNLPYENVIFKTKDGVTISGWYIPAKDEKGTVVFCHGNAGNVSHFLEHIKVLNGLRLSVLAFDYRGYGKSDGAPSEKGIYLDAEAAWDYLVNEYGKTPQNIIVVGHSLGGAVATELAMRKKPAVLIVESSFTSLPDLAANIYPWLPVRLMSKHQYASINKVSSIPCPKLFIHSPDDEIVPFEQGRALFEKASEPKEFLLIKGGHNDGFLISGKTYSDGLMKFLEKYSIIR